MTDTRDLGQIDAAVLVFGGVYSNREALEALIAEAERLAIPAGRMIHTGDIIAYGADPQACARMLRDLGCPAIKGNVEQQLADGALDCGCGFDEGTGCDLLSARWYAYASKRVDQDLCAWMGAMPDHIRFEMAGTSIRVVHGAPSSVNPSACTERNCELRIGNCGGFRVSTGGSSAERRSQVRTRQLPSFRVITTSKVAWRTCSGSRPHGSS